MSSPSLGWERIKDVYYRTRELYTLQWSFNAIPRLTAISSTRTIAVFVDSIEIYTPSGQLITSIPWNHQISGRILGLQWYNEDLCVLLSNGRVRWYYTFEGDFDEYELGHNTSLTGVQAWGVSTRGLIVLSQGKILRMNRLGKVVIQDLSIQGKFNDWCIVGETIYAAFENEVYRIDRSVTRVSLDGPFRLITASSNGKLISLWNDKGLSIVSAQFDRVLMQWPCERPTSITWCGSDAVSMTYPDVIRLVAPGGDLEFFLDEPCIVSCDADGLSILTPRRFEYLSKVHGATVDCFKIGSRAKSAILIDALEKLMRHSPKTNDNLEIIGDGLYTAVIQCLEAAKDEFDPYWQKKLLKAASFGKAEMEMKQSKQRVVTEFVELCDELRILNLIRDSDIDLFLTYHEFKKLGITKVIQLLLKRQKFTESYQIAQFCRLPLDLVFINWACSKIKYSNVQDEELSKSIITKFQSVNDNRYISFAKISSVAFQEGRLNLAKILINFESLFSKQIPLLLQMEEHGLALTKALDSQDIDLILETLLVLKSTLSYPQFFKLLNNSKTAANVFEYFNLHDEKLIHDFYNQADRLADLANYQLNNITRLSVQSALEIYQKRNQAVAKQLERQQSLMDIQDELTSEFNIDFTGQSLSETILALLKLSQTSRVSQVVKKFKFNDRKLAYLKLEHYCQTQRWDELLSWALQTKTGLHPEAIINRCLKSGEKRLAMRLLNTLNVESDAKVEILFRLKELAKVVEEAVKRRDGALLDRIEEMNDDPVVTESIREARARVGSRFF